MSKDIEVLEIIKSKFLKDEIYIEFIDNKIMRIDILPIEDFRKLYTNKPIRRFITNRFIKRFKEIFSF